jgi:hypothetical protein
MIVTITALSTCLESSMAEATAPPADMPEKIPS